MLHTPSHTYFELTRVNVSRTNYTRFDISSFFHQLISFLHVVACMLESVAPFYREGSFSNYPSFTRLTSYSIAAQRP